MITHSPAIAVTLAVDMTALLLYNVAGMAVTGHLGAVFRTVLETGRTLFVWVVDLLLFYGGVGGSGGTRLGESWSSWSWMQLGGFAVLVAGTLVYGRGDEAEGAAAAEAAAAAGGLGAEVAVAGEEQAATAAAPPSSSSYPSDQLLPSPAPAAAGTFQSQPLPVTMSRRTSTSTPISVIGTPMSFKVGRRGGKEKPLFFSSSSAASFVSYFFFPLSNFSLFYPFQKKKKKLETKTEHDEHQPLFFFLRRRRVPERIAAAGLVGPGPRLVAAVEASAEREQRSLRAKMLLFLASFFPTFRIIKTFLNFIRTNSRNKIKERHKETRGRGGGGRGRRGGGKGS